MAKEEETKKRTKRSTAAKRDLQNKKKRMENRVFKSQVRTAIRNFEDALNKKDAALAKEILNSVYSFMDKGVKKGLFKINKASRTKTRLAARAAAKA
ncbi:MAG: 30S ribosomal protein S20 [Chlamydiae bacterium]|nr:30S ribosomal protein S20 [Chlamydiota bacterium]